MKCLSAWPNLTELKIFPLPHELYPALSELTPKLKSLHIKQIWLEDAQELQLRFKFPEGIFLTLPELENLKLGERTVETTIRINAPNLREINFDRSGENQLISSLVPFSKGLRSVRFESPL